MLMNRRAWEEGSSIGRCKEQEGGGQHWTVKGERPIKGRSQGKKYLSSTSHLGPYCLFSCFPSQPLSLPPQKDDLPALPCQPGLQELDCVKSLLVPWDHWEIFSHAGLPTVGAWLPLLEPGWKLCSSSWHVFGVSFLLCSWRTRFWIWPDKWDS